MTDQPTLRDRIRRAICEASGFTWLPDELMEPDEYGDHADAVMAVLPAPVGRSAGLREAANECDRRATAIDALSSSDFGEEARAARELAAAATEVRRMADEQEAADAYDRAINTPPSAATSEAIRARLKSGTAPRRLRRMADEAQQPEEAGHACDNCEGVDPGTCLANPRQQQPKEAWPSEPQWRVATLTGYDPEPDLDERPAP
ncbi:hypothetical protein GCM10010331_49650 [Streptomyces xanthochromogenes]|uniref:hypothetical protein n=1 Tax=Streptomyces xanthochromogenes TaxID=67384 RepID=UPI0016771BE5|nr:hypothetical protein [Streptomyces xanthochromogenes]GHB55855.1 hypothetical protein GCM10010331_49650 [Streptomyces xanthochromogenes]